MEAITIYQCDDGTRFEAENDAKEYESLCARVKEVMKPMGEKTLACNASEVIQHDLKDVRKALHDFLMICASTLEYYGYKPKAIKKIEECAEKETYTDYVDNIIASCAKPILIEANYRFSCTNMKDGLEYPHPWIEGLEYPHPHYIIHENEFKD